MDDATIEAVAQTIEAHARRHRISNSPYGHVCPSDCLARAVLRELEQEGRLRSSEEVQCGHEWSERGSGPEDRWEECWLCGRTRDVAPHVGVSLMVES